jgi:hypothetical protein
VKILFFGRLRNAWKLDVFGTFFFPKYRLFFLVKFLGFFLGWNPVFNLFWGPSLRTFACHIFCECMSLLEILGTADLISCLGSIAVSSNHGHSVWAVSTSQHC